MDFTKFVASLDKEEFVKLYDCVKKRALANGTQSAPSLKIRSSQVPALVSYISGVLPSISIDKIAAIVEAYREKNVKVTDTYSTPKIHAIKSLRQGWGMSLKDAYETVLAVEAWLVLT